MTRMMTPENIQFLKNEVARWEEDSILNREQGDAILSSYTPINKRSKKATVLLFLGCTLIGASITAAISMNKFSLTEKYWLLGALALAFAAAIIFGWKQMNRQDGQRIFGDAMLLLGCSIYADAIALATQMFNFSSGQNWEAIAFGAGCLPIALATRSQPVVLLCNIAIAVWTSSTSVQVQYRLIAAGAAIAVSYFLRNRWALSLALFSATGSLVLDTYNHIRSLPIAMGTCLISWHMWHLQSRQWKSMAMPYLIVGLGVIGAMGMPGYSNAQNSGSDLILEVLAIVATAASCLKRTRTMALDRLVALLLVILIALSPIEPQEMFAAPPADPTLYLGTLFLAFMYCAARVDNIWFMAVPLIPAAFAVIEKYGQPGSFINFSVGFLVMGCFLMLAAVLILRELKGNTTNARQSVSHVRLEPGGTL
jgi:uncharacterized membrane protein